MVKILGIDLGTTNSVVAIMEEREPIIIPNSNGFSLTPSVLAYTKEQILLIGNRAKRQAIINPNNTFYSIKRFIGKNPKEVDSGLKEVSYPLIEDEMQFKFKCMNLNKVLSAEEILSMILRQITNDAESYIGQKINTAVITVPAYFTETQRQATKNACKLAGLNVLRILNEPTAAALAYGLDKKTNGLIFVFDLGGGTFDVSILDVGDGVFEVLSTAGDTSLGGDNFDKIIVEYLRLKFENNKNTLITENKYALQRLTTAAEQAKIELSTLIETKINIPFITDRTKHINEILTRKFFEKLCEPLFRRCKTPIINSLKKAQIPSEQIDEIILVGGSTRIPKVQDLVKLIFGKSPKKLLNPDEIVAMGAAIQGGILEGALKNILLLDITPFALGIETHGSIFTPIIPQQTAIPVTKSLIFAPLYPSQNQVQLHILQGDRDLAHENKSLGEFTLKIHQNHRNNGFKIKVTFSLDINGILLVTAKDPTTNKQNSIRIDGASKLSDFDIMDLGLKTKKTI